MILDSATRLVELLAQRQVKLVLAESCTGGMIAAELAKVPGVSSWLCGSAVTYRSETKTAWLGVDADLIAKETAVCHQVAEAMAGGVLRTTPEATLSASITGHFGPNAPAGFDGVVFVGIACRPEEGGHDREDFEVETIRYQLVTASRLERQVEAVRVVLELLTKTLAS